MQGQVRSKGRRIGGRPTSIYPGWGNFVTPDTVSPLKYLITCAFEKAGYVARPYNADTSCPEAIAYVHGGHQCVPFREEPFLVDDGGTLWREKTVDGVVERPVLKVAIRNFEGGDQDLNERLRRILSLPLTAYDTTGQQHTVPLRASSKGGTLVYALIRACNFGPGEEDLALAKKPSLLYCAGQVIAGAFKAARDALGLGK